MSTLVEVTVVIDGVKKEKFSDVIEALTQVWPFEDGEAWTEIESKSSPDLLHVEGFGEEHMSAGDGSEEERLVEDLYNAALRAHGSPFSFPDDPELSAKHKPFQVIITDIGAAPNHVFERG